MNDNFAATARRWNALAARMLGWRPDDFWRATPAELTMALADPDGTQNAAPPTRELISHLMERDHNAGQV